MPEFLELIQPDDARQRLLEALPEARIIHEKIDTADGLGRITVDTVLSPESLPGFDRSTVDGYALHASDTYGASDTLPAFLELIGEVPMGGSPKFEIKSRQAALIHTGGMLPTGADAVVMLEYSQFTRDNEIEVLRAVGVGENVLKLGEDIQEGDIVIPAGTKLRPADIGGMLALGITSIDVAKRPVIGILSSGDEIVSPDHQVAPGQVRDINSYTLASLVEQEGGLSCRYGILPDRAEVLESVLKRALEECDVVVITAGSSASSRDLTAQVIQRMGRPGVLVHGVNVRPGKPTILAVCNGKAVIGLPGNPVSALVIARLFVIPVINRLLGFQPVQNQYHISARLSVNIPSQAGRVDFIPVKLNQTDQGLFAEPIFYKSNLIFSLARADGLACIPADKNGMASGDLVEVQLL